MEFAFWWRLGLTIVLLCVGGAAQVAGRSQQVRVLVYGNARISAGLLERAGVETTRIFRSAGIDLVWMNCTSTADSSACRNMAPGKELMLHVVPKAKLAGEFVFGDAFLAEDGSGKYADIFFDRIASTHHEFGVSESRLLGAVAAHEIGHLLLGLRAHSSTGIMSPIWTNDLIQKMETGALLFTSAQATFMRKRVGQSESEINNHQSGPFNVADVDRRTPVSDTPLARLTTFLTSKDCVPTRSPCP